MALPPVYKFVSCCEGYEIWFKFDGTISASTSMGLLGVYNNFGSSITGYGGTVEAGKCYTIYIIPGNEAPSVVFPTLPVGAGAAMYGPAAECGPSELCPPCIPNYKRLIITTCCGGPELIFAYNDETYGTETDIFQYIGTTILFDVNNVPLKPYMCFTVRLENTSETDFASLPLAPTDAVVVLTEKKRCDDNEATPSVPCASCINYYRIVNCNNTEETYCTTSNLSAYINNGIADPFQWPVIQVLEKPNKCFYVEQIDTCAAPIPITKDPAVPVVLSCAKCQAKIEVFYKLIDCNNPQVIVYTSTDLVDYVGRYITLEEYGDVCFYVSVEEGLVPSDVPVTPTGQSYVTCEECALPRYILSDCAKQLPEIITNSDLSAYVGQVVTIENCPGVCWEVDETELSALNGEVTVVTNYDDCPECLSLLPSTCVAFKSVSEQVLDVSVLLPDGTASEVTVQPNSTTDKNCYITWYLPLEVTALEYGTCIDGECPPEPPKRKRRVTPGYDTPACTPEYYENVECHFSEWMYKDVLEKRYGISNCCPEELMKWEIKHEMLMLDALVNPDYTCQPDNSCCAPSTPTCNSCGCSSCNCNC